MKSVIIMIWVRNEAGESQPNGKVPPPDRHLVVNSVCPVGGAVGGCRVLGAGGPGEDGSGAAAHRKNAN